METDEEYLKKRIREQSARAERTGRDQYLGFLTAPEAALVREMALRGEIRHVTLQGGYPEAERVMARFSASEGEDGEDWPIACVLIRPKSEKFAENLTHRDYLGALMAMGVEREVLGDLRLSGARCWCFCREEMAEHILSLREVRHTQVVCETGEDAEAVPPLETKRERVNAASERIDAVVSEVCRVSRSQAAELCRGEKVFLQGRVQTDPSRKLKEGEVFSVRGHGKFRYAGQTGVSKKGRLILEVDRYL